MKLKVVILMLITLLLSFKTYSKDRPDLILCNLDNLGLITPTEEVMNLNYEQRREFFKNWKSNLLMLSIRVPNPSPSEIEWIQQEQESEDYNRLVNLINSKEWNLLNAKRELNQLFEKIINLDNDSIMIIPDDKRLDYEKLSISILAAQLLNSGIYSSFNELAKHSIINREHYQSDLSSTYSFCMEAAQKLILLSASLKK
tara:strand:+ start:182 stop:781 length:600 start_codon:yes stop_codon:yes gene_type:complete